MALKHLFIAALVLLSAVSFAAAKDDEDYDDYYDESSDNSALDNAEAHAVDVYVSHNPAEGQYRTIQQAIDAVPNNNKKRYNIHVRPGVYREKIRIRATKDFITILGAGRDKTTIVFNADAKNSHSTFNSSTFAVDAKYFVATGITFKNDAIRAKAGEEGRQAVALRVGGDMAAFYHCNMVGGQDTLYDFAGRHYFKECMIEGSTDFIFGAGRSLYKHCSLVVNAEVYGAVTAQGRGHLTNHSSGFSFVNCNISLGDGGKANRTIFLGRAWGDSPIVVFSRTYMDKSINPLGWDNMGNGTRNSTSFFAEYASYGPGAAPATSRVPWSKQLKKEQAVKFMSIDYINGEKWLDEDDANDDDIPELRHRH